MKYFKNNPYLNKILEDSQKELEIEFNSSEDFFEMLDRVMDNMELNLLKENKNLIGMHKDFQYLLEPDGKGGVKAGYMLDPNTTEIKYLRPLTQEEIDDIMGKFEDEED